MILSLETGTLYLHKDFKLSEHATDKNLIDKHKIRLEAPCEIRLDDFAEIYNNSMESSTFADTSRGISIFSPHTQNYIPFNRKSLLTTTLPYLIVRMSCGSYSIAFKVCLKNKLIIKILYQNQDRDDTLEYLITYGDAEPEEFKLIKDTTKE